jgi:DNA-binding transcriptional MerR regulator
VVDKSPDAFRTISEAAEELDLPQHVLRFWETRFSTIKPLKRGGGRRYYRPEDVQLLKGIRHLLYDQGYTIKGVQRILRDQGARNVIAIGNGGPFDPLALATPDSEHHNGHVDGHALVHDDPADADVETLIEGRTGPDFENGLNDADREKLSEVLRNLLECKRLLDRAREN